MGGTPRTRPHVVIPAWVIVTLGALITGGALLWTSTLYDDRGEAVLDGPTASVLVALLGALATVLTLQLKHTSEVRHELRPNSGTSTRDAVDRSEKELEAVRGIAEHAVRAARKASEDTDQLREDVQQIRADMTGQASDIRGIRKDIGRIADALNSKE